MESTVEPVEGNKVKLSVTVPSEEFEAAIDSAWRQIAREVKVPGFRNGKVPRKVLEARIDPQVARSEAIQSALPDYYVRAVREHDVDVIAQPEFDITSGEEAGDVSFAAVVEVRPEVEVRGYRDITITVPSPHPSDDDIADQIDRLRAQYADIRTVERPAGTSDYVSIDISGTRDGEPVDGLTADDYLYEVGSGTVAPELDDNLRGLKPGDIVEFDSTPPGRGTPDDDSPDTADDAAPIHFRVLVKEVKEQVLPELTDEWVSDATEFETAAELRDDTIDRLSKVRRAQASMAVQSKLGEALAALVADEMPDPLVNTEIRARLENMIRRLASQGISLEQYLQVTGTDPAVFREDLRSAAVEATKVDLALRAIVVAEGLTPSDEELDKEVEHLAFHAEVDPAVLREQLELNDQIGPIRSDLGNRTALRWLTEQVSIVDEGGGVVKVEELDLDDEHDHDHHDHDDHDDHDEDEEPDQ